ncbi:MAG: hypothetical protein EHM67_10870 [Hyphomicrobiaceae bacterium]|nr:MAG: hypothetical protein EHM67_10870 [Hyphomicrobiaceae bacterium]
MGHGGRSQCGCGSQSLSFYCFCQLLLLPTALHAQAEKRIALLIGNQGYGSEIGCLANPHNDVALLEKTLKALGSRSGTARDAGLAGLHQAVNAYARRMQAAGPNAVGFLY